MSKLIVVSCGMVFAVLTTKGDTLCSGESGEVMIDLTAGTRTAALTERIRYSTAWVDGVASDAEAVVTVNGETLNSAMGTGYVDWTPSCNGTFTLTHKVMSGDEQVGETLTATFLVEGLNPEEPVISPVGGMVFGGSLSVSMTCPTEGATIHFTTNGTEPTAESPVYKRFKIYGKTTVKAVAEKDGMLSEVVTAEYALGQCADPVFSLADGAEFEHSNQEVSIAWNSDGVLRYTLDGSDPTAESPIYEGPFSFSESVVVKAKVFSDDFFDSSVVTASLTRVWVNVTTPVVDAASSFTGSKTKVSISCATEGAVVRYTLNGNEPNSHSTKYTGPFYVTDSCTVKAYAVMPDYLNSEVATFAIEKVWAIGDTMGKPDHGFTTSGDGDADWTRVTDATAPNGEAMKSGAITHEQSSVLSTTVVGPGTLSFSWRTSCEQDDEYEWDHAELAVDGVVRLRLNGVTAWTAASTEITGDGEHTVEWRYIKDDVESEGEDAAWVANYSWTSAWTATRTTEVPVPYAWLRAHDPDVVDEYRAYEAAAKKTAANRRMSVVGCYVLGLDPQDAASEFRIASFPMKADGTPDFANIVFDPPQEQWNVPDVPVVLKGAATLEGPWRTVTEEGGSPGTARPTMQFFKAVVLGSADDDEGGVQLWENGPYWAECNVGATKPEEYGYYFWWGDTVGYTRRGGTLNGGDYSGVTWVSSTGEQMSSSPFYCNNCPTYGKDNAALQSAGYIDGTGNLTAAHDAATTHLGSPWRMPTSDEIQALVDNCTTTWITTNGVSGRLVTGKGVYADRSIFLPAAGYGDDSYLLGDPGSKGFYWSSTPNSNYSDIAWSLYFSSSYFRRDTDYGRYYGQSVRPVRGFAE